MTAPPVEVRTLVDGGQSAPDLAGRIAGYLDPARHSLDLALYDFDLSPAVAGPVLEALRSARARGVAVRVAVNGPRDGSGQSFGYAFILASRFFSSRRLNQNAIGWLRTSMDCGVAAFGNDTDSVLLMM